MNAPPPLVPAEVDLTQFDGFMLNTERLLGSELLALATGEEFRAAVVLWCRAWKQVPAASLPDDDRILARFANVNFTAWRKIKTMALRGFIKCSDGRLYHKVLANDALRAWARHQGHLVEREKDRLRKQEWRDKKQSKRSAHDNDVPRDINGTSTGFPSDVPPEVRGSSALRQGQDRDKDSEPNGSGVSATIDPLKALFDAGVTLLTQAGKTEQHARSLLGKWRKSLNDDGRLMALLVSAGKAHAVEPVAYIEAAILRGGTVSQLAGRAAI